MNNKEFNRNVCFTFFEDYRKTAKELEEDFGKEIVADYYNTIIDYALYGIEPELKGAIKYIWHTTKASINKSIERRSGGFRENIEQTEKVLKYKEENPKATQREIAEATGISLGKVNKVLNASSSSDTNANTNSVSTSDTIREREHEHCSRSTEEQTKEKKRVLEDLSDEELENAIKDYNNKVKYLDIQKKYNLKDKVTKDTIRKMESILKQRVAKEKNEKTISIIKTELQSNPTLINDVAACFGLSRKEFESIVPTLSVSLGAIYNHFKDEDKDWKEYYNNPDNETYIGNKTYLEFIQNIIKASVTS